MSTSFSAWIAPKCLDTALNSKIGKPCFLRPHAPTCIRPQSRRSSVNRPDMLAIIEFVAARKRKGACPSVASAVSFAGLAPAPLRRDGAARPCLLPESRSQSVAALVQRRGVRNRRHHNRGCVPPAKPSTAGKIRVLNSSIRRCLKNAPLILPPPSRRSVLTPKTLGELSHRAGEVVALGPAKI